MTGPITTYRLWRLGRAYRKLARIVHDGQAAVDALAVALGSLPE